MVFPTAIRCLTGKRVPVIKFRKGGATSDASTSSPKGAEVSSPKVKVSNAIDDWLLPARFRRKPIPDDEMESINMGCQIPKK